MQSALPRSSRVCFHTPSPSCFRLNDWTRKQLAADLRLSDSNRTRFGVVQATTFVVYQVNRDPDVRFAMERLEGEYLAANDNAV